MPDDPCFSRPQQQTNETHVVNYVGPFPEMNISYNIQVWAHELNS